MNREKKQKYKKIGIITAWVLISMIASIYVTTAIFGLEQVDGVEMVTKAGAFISLLIPISGAVLLYKKL